MALLQTPAGEIGAEAPHFALPGLDGQIVKLSDFNIENGLVVAFICNHCPYVIAQIEEFVSDAAVMRGIGVDVVAIMPNNFLAYPQDSPENMLSFSREHSFEFPYLLDQTQEVALSYGAVCTPDYFGFDRDLKLRYRGRLDNLRMSRTGVRIPELVNAMRGIKMMSELEIQHPPMGCSIKWKDA